MPLDRASLFGLGLTRGQKIKRGFLAGVKFGGIGVVADVAMIGFQAQKAGRGGLTSAVAGQGVGIAIGIPIAGVISAGLCLIPGVGPAVAMVIASMLATYPELAIGTSATRTIRTLTNANKNVRHLEMGGNYVDSESASRQRMIALQDMNAAMIPGRRYLGQEALLMHR